MNNVLKSFKRDLFYFSTSELENLRDDLKKSIADGKGEEVNSNTLSNTTLLKAVEAEIAFRKEL